MVAISDGAFVTGTFEDAGAFSAVWPKNAFLEIHVDVPVFLVVAVEIFPTADPFVGAVFGEGQNVVGVFDVIAPGEEKLAMVVHALNALGLCLGLGHGRQEHAGEDRDDGDDDEEFDQGEAICSRTLHGHLRIL